MGVNDKPVRKKDPRERFAWQDDEPFDVIRYDDEARRAVVEALLEESREIAK